MILTWLGRSGVDTAFVAALGGVIAQARGLRTRKPVRSLWWGGAVLLGVAFAVGVMQFALITHNFSLAYVAENNATVTPLLYSITGMWSALEGSLLLWALLLSGLIVMVICHYRDDADDDVVRWATLILFVVVAFFILLMVGPADPFLHNPAHVLQGAGPNALLQDNPLVAIHPPLLYFGFVGTTVPFAFAMAMLITGRVHDRWPLEQRRWTVLAWGALSVGIVLGAWWSYQVLGWGGFWGWDPVENAALLPWLTGTAYIHSVIVQDRRGLFRVWNLSLAIATFALTILGTFFTRSGVLQSVHAFASSTLGPVLIGFFFLTVGAGLALLIWRGDGLRASVGIDHLGSREGLFVINNVLFVGFAIVVLLGTVFPLLYQAVNGIQVTVGTPYFVTVATPVGVALLLLMSLAPLSSWRSWGAQLMWRRLRALAWTALGIVAFLDVVGVRRPVVLVAIFLATAAGGAAIQSLAKVVTVAKRRGDLWSAWRSPTTGGMIVHLGVVIMAVAIVVSTSYTQRSEVVLAPGHTVTVDGAHITFRGFSTTHTSLETATDVTTVIDGQVLRPAITRFIGRATQPVGTPAIASNLWRDVYVTFDAVGGNGSTSGAQVATNVASGSVVIGVTVEPLLAWLWIGGLLLGVGSAITFSRRRHREELA